jgi:hypothetical protein
LLAIVKKLLSLVEKLICRMLSGLDLINCLTNSNQEPDSGFDINCQTAECILNMIVLPYLPTIEFLLGDQFNIMVRALKRLAWPSEGGLTTEEDGYAFVFKSFLEAESTERRMLRSAFLEMPSVQLFGKIRSLQVIKEELAQLPCKIASDEFKLSKNMVSS